MIQSKKISVITAIAVCFALVLTVLLIIFGDSEAARLARQPEYVNSLFGDEIISIDIIVDQTTWDDMISNASAKEYIMADFVVNGVKYQSVGVRTKGNASLSQVSRSSSPKRYSLHVKFDKYISNQTCNGLDELILNNLISDSTYMKEYMSQDIMRYIGVQSPLTNYADISVNGDGFGFYIALESYGESYNKRVFEDTAGNYYNVKSMQMGGGNRNANNQDAGRNVNNQDAGRNVNNQDAGRNVNQEQMRQNTGAAVNVPDANQPANAQRRPDDAGSNTGGAIAAPNAQGQPGMPGTEDWNDRAGFMGRGGGSSGGSLEYTDDDPASYPAIFENAIGTVSETDQRKVVKALKNLSTGTELEKYFNVDEVLRYFAAHTVVVNLDSYYSGMAQNYYLLERNGVVSILPWDYHLSYGGFQSGSSSSIVNFPIDTPVSGVTMQSRPLLNMLLSNEEYLAKYHEYLQEIVDNYFNSGLFEQTVRSLQAKITEYVKNDPSAMFTHEQFEVGVDALIELNILRSKSIEGQLNGSIPSTTEGQSADNTNLIDAASLNMSDLGAGGMGGGGMGGGGRGGFGGNFPADGNFADMTQGAIQGGIQGGPGGNFPAGGNSPTSTALSTSDYITYAVLVLILIGAIIFAARFKKNY